MKTLLLKNHATRPAKITLELVEKPRPVLKNNECLIKVSASGINQSDALATMGYFDNDLLPRTPGRDFAGIVVEGPSHLKGKHIWGTLSEVGISADGTQAEYIALATSDVAEAPKNLDLITASAQPLPYVTAYYSLVERAHIKESETVLVTGALGQVGRAAMSICSWKKCPALAFVRGADEVKQATQLGWPVINSEDEYLYEKILNANNGKPIQAVLNSLGTLYWKDFMHSLAPFGRIITISARENARTTMINLFDLYRSNQTIIGINTASLPHSQNVQMLHEIKKGFEENKLTPLEVDKSAIYRPEDANKAYRQVAEGTPQRIVISFE